MESIYKLRLEGLEGFVDSHFDDRKREHINALRLLKSHLITSSFSGMCALVMWLLIHMEITTEEYETLSSLIEIYKPKNSGKYYYTPHDNTSRIAWCDKVISKIENNDEDTEID